MELARLLTHLDLHKYHVLECMVVYNMSKYAEMCEEPYLRKCYHIWTVRVLPNITKHPNSDDGMGFPN